MNGYFSPGGGEGGWRIFGVLHGFIWERRGGGERRMKRGTIEN